MFSREGDYLRKEEREQEKANLNVENGNAIISVDSASANVNVQSGTASITVEN